MTEDWFNRWHTGRIGFHEENGNTGLKTYWPPAGERAGSHNRVLVPLCGKSPDLLWLAAQGYAVTGVELVDVAVREFFSENKLEYSLESVAGFDVYRATEMQITIYCGDYFKFEDGPFDALYDRGALVAMPPEARARYVTHTHALLNDKALIMLITLEYDQAMVQGPPFAVMAEEVVSGWRNMHRLSETDDIDNSPPKFRAAGVTEVTEVVWSSERPVGAC